jgi:hypothetical protein
VREELLANLSKAQHFRRKSLKTNDTEPFVFDYPVLAKTKGSVSFVFNDLRRKCCAFDKLASSSSRTLF